MKIDDAQIAEIARRALIRTKGNRWRAYAYAKWEIGNLLTEEPQKAFDGAARRLADTLKI